MDKLQMMEILQSCLLYFDGCNYDDLMRMEVMKEANIKTGIKLCEYLNPPKKVAMVAISGDDVDANELKSEKKIKINDEEMQEIAEDFT